MGKGGGGGGHGHLEEARVGIGNNRGSDWKIINQPHRAVAYGSEENGLLIIKKPAAVIAAGGDFL